MSMNLAKSRYSYGFTLIEVSIAILLIGILLGSVLQVSGVFRDIDKDDAQQRQMKELENAMLTYLKVNNHLPCPDTDQNGLENRTTRGGVETCTSRSGRLPYKDIGASGEDEWGNPFYYRVNHRTENQDRINSVCETASVFAITGNATIPNDLGYCPSVRKYYCDDCNDACGSTLCQFGTGVPSEISSLAQPPYFRMFSPPIGADTAGEAGNGDRNHWVMDRNGDQIDNAIPFMIVSFGRNGAETWQGCNGAGSDERENCDNDVVFVLHDGNFQPPENRDYLAYLTIWDIKQALVESGAYQ